VDRQAGDRLNDYLTVIGIAVTAVPSAPPRARRHGGRGAFSRLLDLPNNICVQWGYVVRARQVEVEQFDAADVAFANIVSGQLGLRMRTLDSPLPLHLVEPWRGTVAIRKDQPNDRYQTPARGMVSYPRKRATERPAVRSSNRRPRSDELVWREHRFFRASRRPLVACRRIHQAPS